MNLRGESYISAKAVLALIQDGRISGQPDCATVIGRLLSNRYPKEELANLRGDALSVGRGQRRFPMSIDHAMQWLDRHQIPWR